MGRSRQLVVALSLRDRRRDPEGTSISRSSLNPRQTSLGRSRFLSRSDRATTPERRHPMSGVELPSLALRVSFETASQHPFERPAHPMFGGLLVSRRVNEVVGFHPAGISAISRGLSVRDTPGRKSRNGICILKGCWQVSNVRQIEPCWHPFRIQNTLSELFRGCRFAQSPANR